jgi:hypothetical protein
VDYLRKKRNLSFILHKSPLNHMTKTLTINDETAIGKLLNQIILEVERDAITVEELITKRVEKEVEDYNKSLPEYFKGLVQPSETERVLNGVQIKRKEIDAEKQVYVALQAFQENGFFILVDNRQVESLNELILIEPSTTVSFVKLTALVGG